MTSFSLKILAMITMLIDHIGAILFPQYIFLRIIGRISFPIYCFLLVEGYTYTHNLKKYMLRIGLFALISEIPYDLTFNRQIFYINEQNIFFTLFIGLLVIHCINHFKSKKIIVILCILISCLIAYIINCDYRYIGVLTIIGFYIFRNSFVNLTIWQSILSLPPSFSSFKLFSLIPIFLYNGKKGYSLKYVFYIFYPLHLLILYFIANYIII